MLKTKELKGMQTYFILHDWMTDKLELHGVSLLVYGLIYSFSITGKEVYDGSLEYLSHRLSVSKSSVCRVLDKLVNSRLIEKSDIHP